MIIIPAGFAERPPGKTGYAYKVNQVHLPASRLWFFPEKPSNHTLLRGVTGRNFFAQNGCQPVPGDTQEKKAGESYDLPGFSIEKINQDFETGYFVNDSQFVI